jgi:hypothetical protein
MKSYKNYSILKGMDQLQEKGYAILPNIITHEKVEKARGLFFDWLNTVPSIEYYHMREAFNGLMKYGQIGHQKHAWFLKTCPEVQKVFKDLWQTDELVTGFDGCCWIPSDLAHCDMSWTHTDQSASAKGLCCIQGFVSLTDNVDRSFVVYEGSHLLHESYMKKMGYSGNRNWRIIDEEYLSKIKDTRKVLKVNAGDMVLWDSRVFHQNQYGKLAEERLVQYVCFLPKNNPSNTEGMRRTRVKYYEKRRSTSHWPYPLSVNPAHPPEEILDVPQVDLSEYDEEIRKII